MTVDSVQRRVAGIDASVGQATTFQIPIDLFMQADPLLIVAECKWAKPTGKMKEYVVAGFEILDLPANGQELAPKLHHFPAA